MKWIEIRISTTEEAYDAISEMLTAIGAGGVAIEDPNDIKKEIAKPNTLDYADEAFLQSLGEEVIIKAYFEQLSSPAELVTLIQEKIAFISNFLDTGKGFDSYREVDEEDWANAWKKYYKPFPITGRIVIKPTWEHYESGKDEIVIEMDPGMAFGTGTHETTRLCAVMLEKYLQKGDKVLDLGCGTGILSIIASKLGAGKITAADIDEVAVRITAENCRLNGIEDGVSAVKGVLEDIRLEGNEKVDVFVANIIANVIVDIAQQVPNYLKKGGCLITSGIIKERKQQVLDTYASLGFKLLECLELGEWVAIVFKCPDSL